MSESGSNLLEVSRLRTTFDSPRGVVRAVDDVSLSLSAGSTLGLVGESGSGKSVLARSIMGLLPSGAKLAGSVVFNGVELVGRTQKEMRTLWGTDISIVFQDPMTSLSPVKRVGEQVAEPLRVRLGLSARDARNRTLELFGRVGIPNPEQRYRQYPHQFSGGMRQRAMIAIALACGPQLLLADEPTTALDVTVQAHILELLADLGHHHHMSMILVTHDLGVVSTRTDHIAVMYAGRIVEYAPTRTLFKSMCMPYTEALFQSIPKLENPSHTRLRVIEGLPANPTSLPPGCTFAPRCSYVTDRCRAEEPPLVAADDAQHLYRCWHPVSSPAGRRPAAVEV